MRPAFTPSIRRPALVVYFVGLLCLSYLSLLDQGTSRMYAWPGEWFYWIMIVSPALLFLWRVAASPAPLRLPALPWLALITATGSTLLAAALASPYRAPCLLWTALPLAGLAVFLLVHDWLQAASENVGHLQRYQAVGAGLLMLASTAWWLHLLSQLTSAQIFSATLFEIRNPHPLGHSNYTAGLALLCLPMLVQARRQFHGAARLAVTFAAGLALLALFTSGSRGGLLGLVALGLAALATSAIPRRRLLMLGGAVVIAASLLALANPRIRGLLRSADANSAPNISNVQRHAMLDAGLLMGRDRPLLGWGLHTTPLVYPRYRAQLMGGAENVLQLHNTPVELWAGLGAAGLLLLAGFVALVVRHRARTPGAVAALAGYGVFALTDYQLDVPVILLGLVVLAAPLATPGPLLASRRSRAGLIVILLGTILAVAAGGARDRTPALNTAALALARDATQATRAIALLEESLALNSDQEIAHFNLGWLLVVSDPARAERHFLMAARLVPDKGGVYFGLGLARLNQGQANPAAAAFALECLNDPSFLASPWWREPALAALREAAAAHFARFCAAIPHHRLAAGWPERQAALLATLAPTLGEVSPGPEKKYRRERTGYPVLMRNLNLPPPLDLYDIREDPRFASRVTFPLPPKGWLPAPLLLKLLDGGDAALH